MAVIAVAVTVSPAAVGEDEAQRWWENSHNAKKGMHAQEQGNFMD
jgi:hypothetical protein